MTRLVIDASVAIKWVVEEADTDAALTLRRQASLLAPDLLVPECANILWKKVGRRELLPEEALLAARLLMAAEIELRPMRSLLEAATRIAVALDHAAYDCIYLALAVQADCRFVTADAVFVRKVRQHRHAQLGESVLLLREAAARLGA